MASKFQHVFNTAESVPQVTFVFVSQKSKRDRIVNDTRKINAHLARHRHAKRQNELFNGQNSAVPANHSSQESSQNCFPANNVEMYPRDERIISGKVDRDLALSASGYFDKPLLSSLDPFLRLPIELSQRDKSILAYFLTIGRQRWPGTSKNPNHCIGVRIARDWLQYSPLHVSYMLMSADYIVTKISLARLPISYYKRRMEILALVRTIIASPASTYSYKLYAVMVMIWTAYTMDLPDVQIHLNAVNTLLQTTGSGQRFALREPEGPTLRPQWLVGMFLVTEYRITTYRDMVSIKAQFISSLSAIRSWSDTQQLFCKSADQQPEDLRTTFRSLYDFLIEPLHEACESDPQPFAVVAAPFLCYFSIATLFASRNTGKRKAAEYLCCLQRKLSMIDGGCSAGGTALSHMLADARFETSDVPVREWHKSEILICQSVINALKIYSLLSTNARIAVNKALFSTIFGEPKQSHMFMSKTEKQFNMYEAEIEQEWLRRQT